MSAEDLKEMSRERAGESAELVDLPGLITDAHLGKGLGRVVWRHARRCRLLLYVLDALDASGSGLSPSEQYRALHRELSLYNPEYTRRPHVVAINKLDLLLELEGRDATARRKADEVAAVLAVTAELGGADAAVLRPLGVVGISAKVARGLDTLQRLIDAGLADGRTAGRRRRPARAHSQNERAGAARVRAGECARLKRPTA